MSRKAAKPLPKLFLTSDLGESRLLDAGHRVIALEDGFLRRPRDATVVVDRSGTKSSRSGNRFEEVPTVIRASSKSVDGAKSLQPDWPYVRLFKVL